jgi:hypothetical protein
MTTVLVCDATHDNVARLPHGMAAGYATGTGTHIRWTAADWAAHPGAVRICQNPAASDPTADVLDVEQGAATPATAPGWVKRARAAYDAAARPGQRKPAIYASRSRITEVCNALTAGGVTSGVGLWIADWGKTQAQAEAEVAAAAGPYPVIGVQFRNAGQYDMSVFSQAWLQEVSVTAPARPPAPPGQWKSPAEWTWKEPVVIAARGLDGELHMFALTKGEWVKVL